MREASERRQWLRGQAAVVGVGETDYSRNSDKGAVELQFEASLKAIDDAGLSPRDIDGIIPIGITGAPVEDYIINFGIPDLRYSAVIPHGGASGIGALQAATAAVASGICSNVLVTSGRNVSSGARAGARIHQMPQFHLVTEFEREVGAIAPAQLYAPMARRHMELFGTTSEHLAEIAVSTRDHATRNPAAIMRKPISAADHAASRMITDPFRLLDCSLESDGGAAFVVTSAERAKDLRHPLIEILGIAMGHPDSPNSITQREILTSVGIAKAAQIAFDKAQVSRSEIQIAEIYDCFTFVVLCQIEDLGFCAKGEGGEFIMDGKLRKGGSLPTNTHGGLLSQAHMLGMNHIVELVRQLRGHEGERQVPGVRTGLATGYGDMGDGGVVIMGGPGRG